MQKQPYERAAIGAKALNVKKRDSFASVLRKKSASTGSIALLL